MRPVIRKKETAMYGCQKGRAKFVGLKPLGRSPPANFCYFPDVNTAQKW